MGSFKYRIESNSRELLEIQEHGFDLVEVLKPKKVLRCIRNADGRECTLSKKPSTHIDDHFKEIWERFEKNRDRFEKLYIPEYYGTIGEFVVFEYIGGKILPWSEVGASPYFGGKTIGIDNVEDIVILSQELDTIGVFTDFHWGNMVFMDGGRIGIIDWEHIIPCRRSSTRLAYLYCLMFGNQIWQREMIEMAKKYRLLDYQRFKEDVKYRATLFYKQWMNHIDIKKEQETILKDIQSGYRFNAQWNGIDLDKLLNRSKYQVFEDLGQEKTLNSQIDCQGKFDCLGVDRYDFSGKSLLDIGCNAGWFLKEYARLGASKVIGIDIEQEWCEIAREILEQVYMLKNVSIYKMEFYEYEAPEVDIVVASSVLHYFEDKKRFFDHAYHVLSDGGLLIVEVPVTEDGSDTKILDMQPKRYIPGRDYLERVAAESGFRLDFFGRSNLHERRVFHFQRQ